MKKFFTFLLTSGEKGARIQVVPTKERLKTREAVKVLKNRPVFLWKRTELEKPILKWQNDGFARKMNVTSKRREQAVSAKSTNVQRTNMR